MKRYPLLTSKHKQKQLSLGPVAVNKSRHSLSKSLNYDLDLSSLSSTQKINYNKIRYRILSRKCAVTSLPVIFVGPPGIGKTNLVQKLLRSVPQIAVLDMRSFQSVTQATEALKKLSLLHEESNLE